MAIIMDRRDGRYREVRWSRQRKAQLVLRALTGESVELLAAEHDVALSRLLQWRETFVAAGTEALKGMP
jgi:transposase-like protein